ncbi:NADH-dependent flavin oxidoreductase [Penicillium lividum]|nr:NADH-dependent flavin oxidoreductase [Penicillium lividum]
MTEADIENVKDAWIAAVKRVLKAGADFIENHVAHGFLLHSFASPVSNQRTDKYGGSFENRIRLSLEIAELTRKNVPHSMPVMVRISATDWLEEALPGVESWTLADTVQMAKALADQGCIDVLDISSGGSHPAQQINSGPCFQVSFAKAVKDAVGDRLLVGTVGMIYTGEIANQLVTDGGLDFVLVGRGFQKNPGLVWTWAEELGVDINMSNQNQWGFSRRGADNLYIIHKND